mgnify:CR=1 FL=1
MENIRTVSQDLPSTINGFTVASNDDWYTIFINDKLSPEQKQRAYEHELEHIYSGDFSKKISVNNIENAAHRQSS